jgi:hypothetical protein
MPKQFTAISRPHVATVALLIAFNSVAANAQPIYKCKDASGKTVYSDKLCSYTPDLVDLTDNGGSGRMPLKTQAPDPKQFFNTSGEKVSMNFQSIEIGSLMQVMSDFSGKKLAVDPMLRKTVNFQVNDMPWHLAVLKVTTDNGMAVFKVRDNTFLIIPAQMDVPTASNRAKQLGL